MGRVDVVTLYRTTFQIETIEVLKRVLDRYARLVFADSKVELQ